MKLNAILAACVAAFVAGCGGGADKPPPYANVSGTVTFNGKPLEKGTITFSTDGRPPSPLDIVDGKYSGQAMTGSNKVSISAKKKTTAKAAQGSNYEAQMKAYAQNGPPGSTGGGNQNVDIDSGEEMMPPEWSTNSKQMRVIEGGAANKLDFDIKVK